MQVLKLKIYDFEYIIEYIIYISAFFGSLKFSKSNIFSSETLLKLLPEEDFSFSS